MMYCSKLFSHSAREERVNFLRVFFIRIERVFGYIHSRHEPEGTTHGNKMENQKTSPLPTGELQIVASSDFGVLVRGNVHIGSSNKNPCHSAPNEIVGASPPSS
jgi:hypothetical protein